MEPRQWFHLLENQSFLKDADARSVYLVDGVNDKHKGDAMGFRPTKLAKCSRCLPDIAGAIFEASYVGNLPVWKCNNCHLTKPRTTLNPKPKVTKSQKEVIDLLLAMGWKLKSQTFHGRSVWVEFECDNAWYNGNRCYGSIGVRGSFKLHATSFGNPPVITDRIGIKVYLEVKKPV